MHPGKNQSQISHTRVTTSSKKRLGYSRLSYDHLHVILIAMACRKTLIIQGMFGYNNIVSRRSYLFNFQNGQNFVGLRRKETRNGLHPQRAWQVSDPRPPRSRARLFRKQGALCEIKRAPNPKFENYKTEFATQNETDMPKRGFYPTPKEGGRILLTEIQLARTARQGTVGLISTKRTGSNNSN